LPFRDSLGDPIGSAHCPCLRANSLRVTITSKPVSLYYTSSLL